MSQNAEYDSPAARDRDSGSIGIGAMIVFIALILVAAVASTIIIKTAEELQLPPIQHSAIIQFENYRHTTLSKWHC